MPVTSLYWFAAQQQTSTLRRQKYDWFYLKFNAQSKEIIPSILRQQEVA